MSVTVAAIMRQINNHFVAGYMDGEFNVWGGALSPAPVGAAYVYVSGSMMHDGAWACSNGRLEGDAGPAETFTGRVWLLAPPADFLALCAEISAYDEKNPAGAPVSESFGEYSYTRTNAYTGDGLWMTVFRSQLAPYRRMLPEVLDSGAE